MNNNKTRMIWLGFIVLAIYVYHWLPHRNAPSFHDVQLMGGFALLQLIYTYYSWRKCEGSLFNAYIVFISAFYAFNVGQPIIEFFNASTDYRRLWDSSYAIDPGTYMDATFFGMVCLLSFHIGAILSASKLNNKASQYELTEYEIDAQMEIIKRVCTGLVLFSAPFYLYNLVSNLSAVALYGYDALYNGTSGASHVLALLSEFYTPGLLALYFVSLYQRRSSFWIGFTLIATTIAPPLILGGRSNAVILLAIMVVVYNLVRHLSRRQIVIIGLGGIAVLFVCNIVFQTRHTSNKTLETYIEAATKAENNPVLSTVEEMGWSMFPLAKTIEFIPAKRDFDFGASFLWETFSIVPNIGFGDVHPARAHEASVWLQEYLGFSYGIGYSLVAEFYHNFGFMGWLLAFLFGYCYCSLFRYANEKYLHINPVMLVIGIAFLWFSIKGVRNSFLGVVRGVVYYLLPMYLLMKNYLKKYNINI